MLEPLPQHLAQQLGRHRLLYLTRYGSHLYGVSTPTSDEDYKGLFLPAVRDLVLQKAPQTFSASSKPSSRFEKNNADDIDTEVYALQYFFHLLLKSDTNMISILFSRTNPEAVLYKDAAFARIWEEVEPHRLLSRNLAGMAGYVKSQVYKYSLKGFKYSLLMEMLELLRSVEKPNLTLKENLQRLNLDVVGMLETRYPDKKVRKFVDVVTLPNPDGSLAVYLEVLGKKLNFRDKLARHITVLESLENSFGHRARTASEAGFADLKAVYHAFRVLYEIEELHTTGALVYPLANREYLREIRAGKYSMDELAEGLEERLAYVEGLEAASRLPQRVDSRYMDELVLRFYTELHGIP